MAAQSRDYGTANYLADPRSDGFHWVETTFCRRCGAVVFDIARHNQFHERLTNEQTKTGGSG